MKAYEGCLFSNLLLKSGAFERMKVTNVCRTVGSSSANLRLREVLREQLEEIRTAGTFKSERIITSSQSVQITVEGSNRTILNFCANNYLGLAV